MTARLHGSRTGRVFIRDFDLGMAISLGAVPDTDPKNNRLLVTFPQLPSGNDVAPLIYKTPESTLQWFQFPRVMLSLDAWEPALVRWQPITEEYRIASPSSAQVPAKSLIPSQPDPIGPSGIEGKIQTWPFDLTYTIEVWHRMKNWTIPMIFQIMKRFPPYGSVTVKDSLGDDRTYNTFMEGGPKDLAEALGMTDRGSGYALTVRVTGELDLDGPDDEPTVRTINPDLFPVTTTQARQTNETQH